jgi:exodeoxyribonuclease VII small subunit
MKGMKKMQEQETVSFEENMKKLEEIAAELEKGELDLDTSVSKFEEGMKISKECNEMLEKAEKKITMLIKGEDGEVVEENFVQNEE